jgi:hypothetical protein
MEEVVEVTWGAVVSIFSRPISFLTQYRHDPCPYGEPQQFRELTILCRDFAESSFLLPSPGLAWNA